MTRGDVTPWARLSPSETREVIFHSWLCRAQLDRAEARQRAGDRLALLCLPGYARPDDAVAEKFQTYFRKIKSQHMGDKPHEHLPHS